MEKSHLRIKLKMDPPKMYNKINKQNQENYPITHHLLFWGNTAKQLELTTFTFMHLADAFIQSDFVAIFIQAIHFVFVSVCSLRIKPTPFVLLT